MTDSGSLGAFSERIRSMEAWYAGLGMTMDDTTMVKKLLDTMPDRLYAVVAGIKQFCNVDVMLFKEVLGQLKAFNERTWQRA
ncbi:retrotransposon protein [Hordeum vulgare]|nr:retrotransposon protein [Hordeum vulgare]